MSPSTRSFFGESRSRQCFCALVVGGCLLLSGCAGVDLRGESFPEGEMSRQIQEIRHPSDDSDSFAFSNKARQIDRSLGGP